MVVKLLFQPQSRHEADLRFKSMLSMCTLGISYAFFLRVWMVEEAIKRMLFLGVVTSVMFCAGFLRWFEAVSWPLWPGLRCVACGEVYG